MLYTRTFWFLNLNFFVKFNSIVFLKKTQQFPNETRNLERKWHLRSICGSGRERRFMLLMTLLYTLFYIEAKKHFLFLLSQHEINASQSIPDKQRKFMKHLKGKATLLLMPRFRIIWGGPSQWTFMQIVFFYPYDIKQIISKVNLITLNDLRL